MHRRTFLQRAALGGAAFGVGGCGSTSAPGAAARARGRAAGGDAAGAVRVGGGVGLQAMADAILAADPGELSALALGWHAAGAGWRDVLSAAYLAGLREIDPSPIGGQVHALMMVASASAAIGALPADARPLPALFHLQRVKAGVARDEQAGDWTMPSPPAPDAAAQTAPRAQHAAAFAAAMADWDEPAADRAAVLLHAELSLRGFFEELWPWAARDFRVIGHKMIFATQTFRAIEDLGWRSGLPAVRAVVRGVLDQNPYGRFGDDESRRILATFDANRELAAGIPGDWRVPRDAGAHGRRLLEQLREADLAAAPRAVTAALQAGADEQAVWDGLRLFAFELVLRHPGIAGVHPVTSVNALWRGSQLTARDATRRLCALQAASWLVLFREFLPQRGTRDLRLDLDAGGAAGKGSPPDPFAERDEAAARAAAGGLAAVDAGAFAANAIATLARKAVHDHDYKFTIAAVEELAAAAPRWQPALASASMAFLRRQDADDHAVVEELAAWRRG